MKTKTVSPTPSTDNAFLRIAIHRSPRQPRQTPPLLLDNPRRRTPTTPATLQSRRRTAEATSEDRRRSSCDSDSTQSSSRCLRPRLAVGANREAGVAGSPRPKSPARATFDSGSAACPRPEGQRAKSSERRRKEGKTSSTVSAPGGYRCARDSVEGATVTTLSRRCRWRDLDGCHGRNRHR